MASSAVTATVLPNELHSPTPHPKPRYIRWVDFDNGDDNKDGLTRETAWKTVHGLIGGNDVFWNGSPDNIEAYFHGGQIGPGYEYRLRGTCEDELVTIQTQAYSEDDRPFVMSLIGTSEHPIVFTSWDVVHDRAVLKGDYYVIETTSGEDEFESGNFAWDDHYDMYIGIDFQLKGQNNVFYGNYTWFIDCTFAPNPTAMSGDHPEEEAGLLIYGDWLVFDRCYFRSCNQENLLLYGVYLTIQNCVFYGLNFRGFDIDRSSDNDQTNSGSDWLWLIYLQQSAPPFDQSDALRIINNTIVGWGGTNTSIYGFGLIYADYSHPGRYTSVYIRNNLYSNVGAYLSNDPPLPGDVGIWSVEPNLAPIFIDHNLFASDIFNIPQESFYYNAWYPFDDPGQPWGITFDPDTDKWAADPKFVNRRNGDFRLRGGSEAINGGSSDLAPDYDFKRLPRVGDPDMGAYEHHRS